MIFPRPRPDDIIEPFHITTLQDAINEGPTVVAPLAKTPAGAIYLADQPGFWIVIMGSPVGTAYPWQLIIPTTSGGWMNGPSNASGTASLDPAYELNGSTQSLTGMRARAWRDKASNEVRFSYDVCS